MQLLPQSNFRTFPSSSKDPSCLFPDNLCSTPAQATNNLFGRFSFWTFSVVAIIQYVALRFGFFHLVRCYRKAWTTFLGQPNIMLLKLFPIWTCISCLLHFAVEYHSIEWIDILFFVLLVDGNLHFYFIFTFLPIMNMCCHLHIHCMDVCFHLVD